MAKVCQCCVCRPQMLSSMLVTLVCLCLVTLVCHVPSSSITCWQLVICVGSSSVQQLVSAGGSAMVAPGHWFVSDTHTPLWCHVQSLVHAAMCVPVLFRSCSRVKGLFAGLFLSAIHLRCCFLSTLLWWLFCFVLICTPLCCQVHTIIQPCCSMVVISHIHLHPCAGFMLSTHAPVLLAVVAGNAHLQPKCVKFSVSLFCGYGIVLLWL